VSYSGAFEGLFLVGRDGHLLVPLLVSPVLLVI
jgi:hypothetical protein